MKNMNSHKFLNLCINKNYNLYTKIYNVCLKKNVTNFTVIFSHGNGNGNL